MQIALTILTILTVFFGALSVIQFLMSIASGSSQRARAQASYNSWYKVAEMAEKIAQDPSKASEFGNYIHGIADFARNDIKAYSREKFRFEIWFDPAYQVGKTPSPPVTWWQKVKSAFIPK
jgi:hypothetical protein